MRTLALPALAALLVAATFAPAASAQQRTVDARYAPMHWHAAISLPDDWQKTLVDDEARLLYDFGPGPYVRPKTTVAFGFAENDTFVNRQLVDRARGGAPVVKTRFSTSPSPSIPLSIEEMSFGFQVTAFSSVRRARVPEPPGDVVRLEGTVGSPGWASPPEDADPAFVSVAWGPNRPVRYRLRVPPGSRQRVVLGFAEGHRTQPGQRVFRLEVEGSDDVEFDPIATGTRDEPQVVVFDARDADGDGYVTAEVHAAATDPNTYLNALWVFPRRQRIDTDALIRGALNADALHYVDAGREHEPYRPLRVDVMTYENPGGPRPGLDVATSRRLTANESFGLDESGAPFIVTQPRATSAERTETGWRLTWPAGTDTVTAYILHGSADARSREAAANAPFRGLSEPPERIWQAGLPRGTIRVPDAGIQNILDASVRTLYQSRDLVDGRPQFQPGMALYRGLWVHDAAYLAETALLLGDTTGVRQSLEGMLAFQAPSGQVKVMRPLPMNRETALFVWTLSRYARLTGDDDWLRARWDHVVRGLGWVAEMREQTLADPAAPYYGLMPPGFADGGLGGVTAEYSSVYWALIALENALEDAERLGETEHVAEWRALYADLLASWRGAAARDMRRDEHGNPYLPVQIGGPAGDPPAPQAQWMLTEAATFGDFLAPRDTLVDGTFAMLEAAEVQGIPLGVGWMEDGIWAYYGGFYGMLHLLRGDREKAVDVLYAFANHATPHGTWAEEQMPKHVSAHTAGDYPHAWASAFFIRLVRHMIASERGDDLVLLGGVPAEWLTPGSHLSLSDGLTDYGTLRLGVAVGPRGRTAHVSAYLRDADDVTLRVDMRAFRELGYVAEDGSALPDELVFPAGRTVSITVRAAR